MACPLTLAISIQGPRPDGAPLGSGRTSSSDSKSPRTATDVVEILRKKREPLVALEVRAEARRAEQPPMVYDWIRLTYRVSGHVHRKAVADAVRLSKSKYCSVSAMLQKTADIETAIDMVQESAMASPA